MTKQELKDKIDDIADAQRTVSECGGALLKHIDTLEALVPKPPEPETPKTQWLYRFDGGPWILSYASYASEDAAKAGIYRAPGTKCEFKRFTQKEGE